MIEGSVVPYDERTCQDRATSGPQIPYGGCGSRCVHDERQAVADTRAPGEQRAAVELEKTLGVSEQQAIHVYQSGVEDIRAATDVQPARAQNIGCSQSASVHYYAVIGGGGC